MSILRAEKLAMPWPGVDPFLFCMHHADLYPEAEGQAAPAERLRGRALGADFSGRDGFSMYHGESVPGFPAHPHRGFETVTVVDTGLVDHSDSLGTAARYGDGDVQWLTTGRGVMHSEMFPLRDAGNRNPLRLHQIWLNLPARSKMVEPAFRILWDGDIPRYRLRTDGGGGEAVVKAVAGPYAPQERPGPPLAPPPPPPHSWAADPANDVAIWQITLEPGARVTLPPATQSRTRRTLYVHAGSVLQIDGRPVSADQLVEVAAHAALRLENGGATTVEILLLQGVPIGEPVVMHGPFVMNSRAEIEAAINDFRRTRFGGWPWPSGDPVHPAGKGRFAQVSGGAGEDRPAPSAEPLSTMK